MQPRPDTGGFGLFAREPIRAGELLAVWSGRIVTPQQLDRLPEEIQRHTVQVEEDLYLASIYPDEPADYFNHSCDPNAGLSGQIVIVALRDLFGAEEVCIDYAMCDGSPYDEFECQCHTPNCRKRVTGNDWRRPELWQRYAGHFSPYLQRRIDQLRASQAV
jgi:SET domain-containing protein